MKKLLLTILFTVTPALAYEDILIISPTPVNSVVVKDNNIVEAKPIFTIDNEKKFIIITPKNKGKSEIEIKTNNETQKIKININKNTNISLPDNFNMFEIDTPPELIEIPEPPSFETIPKPPSLPQKGGK